MITNTIITSLSTMLSSNCKVLALETCLQQSLLNFKELVLDMEKLHIEAENYKTELMEQKTKCESNTCSGVNNLKKVIESKDNTLQLVASTLTKLNETKNWDILDEIFNIIFNDNTHIPHEAIIKHKDVQTPNGIVKKEPISPKKELCSPTKEVRDESMSEIEGTPTGRTSPIIQTKKLKNSTVMLEKKKCPDSWPTPESKAIKLIFPTPCRSKSNGRLRQSKLNIVPVKTSNIIDITCSPEFSGGSRSGNMDSNCNVQPLIKKESMENDDTILPSPTSGPSAFTLFKSPMKFKKPPLSLKNKTDKCNTKKMEPDIENRNIKMEQNKTDDNVIRKQENSVTYTQNDSINILNPRLPTKYTRSPLKQVHNDTTFCDTQASVSLLQNVERLDDIHVQEQPFSPSKRPLAENINITNMADDDELQASMSLLQRDAKANRINNDSVKRKLTVEPVYEEKTPKTRAEKRQLPGWACENCISFFGELYKDDPEMMNKKINECSHHRGVTNPERPKTPPGFWNPRWKVPDDTEEFNRRNNVA